MAYRNRIQEIAPSYDARHIEAYLRLEHGTLDRLDPHAFAAEVVTAVMCIEAGGADAAERLAQSYGL